MDELSYSIATEDDRKGIREFLMKHFLKEETMNVATGITEEEFAPFADKVLDIALPTPFTVICRNGNGDIVGVAVSTIYRRDDPEFVDPLASPQRPEIAAIVDCRDLLSVASAYHRRGIAGKMLDKRKSPEFLKKYGVQGFICQASSYANQMLLKKRKDQELMDVPFTRFTGKNGAQLIQPQDETLSVKLFWKPYNP
ncbi:unnamed protein product [Cylicostephanus goldi]|uniref:N-acetyltransferase domain-containing protein n=1 Tax=Cylicostephanus goldi TaxID=71465 RepID=A0A3P7M5S8_CYLGO|nr:unnamed protein product [Cylicostephanus goldi]